MGCELVSKSKNLRVHRVERLEFLSFQRKDKQTKLRMTSSHNMQLSWKLMSQKSCRYHNFFIRVKKRSDKYMKEISLSSFPTFKVHIFAL